MIGLTCVKLLSQSKVYKTYVTNTFSYFFAFSSIFSNRFNTISNFFISLSTYYSLEFNFDLSFRSYGYSYDDSLKFDDLNFDGEGAVKIFISAFLHFKGSFIKLLADSS